MEELYLELIDLKGDETELGESHFLGCPDVPGSWNDNAVFLNDELFIGQVNLEQLNIDRLPKKGMLYFFLAVGSRPYRGIVRYYDGDEELERVDFNCEVGIDFDFDKEYSVKVKHSAESSFDHLFASSHSTIKKNLDSNKEICLLELSKNSDIMKTVKINTDLCFIIKIEDLNNLNFDKAYLNLKLDE